MTLNQVNLVGYVGNDPVNSQKNGISFTRFRLATNTYRKGVSKTEWHDLVCFQNLAELAAKFVRKGSMLSIRGHLSTTRFKDSLNIDRWSTKIIIENMT